MVTDGPAADLVEHSQQSVDHETTDTSEDHEMQDAEMKSPHHATEQLTNMGFSQQQAKDALDHFDSDIPRAISYLLDTSQPSIAVDSPKPSKGNDSAQLLQTTAIDDIDMDAKGVHPKQDVQSTDQLHQLQYDQYGEEPDLMEQAVTLQKEALAAKRQGDKKRAVQLLRQSKALKEKANAQKFELTLEDAKEELHSEPAQRPRSAQRQPPTQDEPEQQRIEAEHAQASAVPSGPSPDEIQQLMHTVIRLQKQYKEAALHYQNTGNVHQAKEMLGISKELLRQGVQLKNGQVQDIASIKKSLPGEPDMNLGDGKIRQVQQIEPNLASTNTMEHLESQLTYQVNVCHNLAVQAATQSKSKQKTSTNREYLLQLEQAFAADAVSLRSRRDQKQESTPRLHYEQVEYRYKNILEHIPTNQMELKIVRATGLQSLDVSSPIEPFVTWNFGGWPPENTAQAHMNKGETPVKKGSDPGKSSYSE